MSTNTKEKFIKEVNINNIQAKTLLRKSKKIDSWFVARYGMNLYRGCQHNCTYCDGRAEKYNVDGEFGVDISVKSNALDLLRKELDPVRKRIPLKKGYVMVGGGVGDSYQQVEKEFGLTRSVLELVSSYNFPVHILTKSTLVERDLDILSKIHEKRQAIVSFSFSTIDERIASIFEPSVPSPTKRLETIAKIKSEGLYAGVYYMPVIPFISDSMEHMEEAIRAFKNAGADFVIFGGMTLKPGKQKDFFIDILQKNFPQKLENYNEIYYGNEWGSAKGIYYQKISEQFINLAKKYEIKIRIPASMFSNMIDLNDKVVVILEQMDYILKSMKQKSPYSYGAYAVAQLKESVSEVEDLTQLKGIGPVTERIIKEIMQTGTSRYYEKLINFDT